MDFEIPKYDLGELHPKLAGVDGVNLLVIALISFFGAKVITQGEL